MTTKDTEFTFEVAVNPEGTVSVNIRNLPTGADGWGHLTFTVEQAIDFVIALQHATAAAYQITSGGQGNPTMN